MLCDRAKELPLGDYQKRGLQSRQKYLGFAYRSSPENWWERPNHVRGECEKIIRIPLRERRSVSRHSAF